MDILTKLYEFDLEPICRDAAAEIERLRAEVERLRAFIESTQMADCDCALCASARTALATDGKGAVDG